MKEISVPLLETELHREREADMCRRGGKELSASANECEREQGYAEKSFEETKQHTLEVHGNRMSEQQISNLESLDLKSQITVISDDEYGKKFPKADVNVLGHCDAEGNIYMKKRSETVISHVSTHETVHRCANREVIEDGAYNTKYVSGLHEVVRGRDGTLIKDANRGINEGVTEMYTLRELETRGETEAAYSINAYSESRMWAQRLEQLVGEDCIADAYFGRDNERLQTTFNRLDSGRADAWERFSKNVDILEYGRTSDEIERAQRELTEQYIEMLLNKDIVDEGVL